MAINKSDRARQFLPFDALKGLQEALREKERELEYEEKRELFEEECDKIANILNKVKKSVSLSIVYYNKKRYVKYEGIVEYVDRVKKKILFRDENEVFIEDILKVEII